MTKVTIIAALAALALAAVAYAARPGGRLLPSTTLTQNAYATVECDPACSLVPGAPSHGFAITQPDATAATFCVTVGFSVEAVATDAAYRTSTDPDDDGFYSEACGTPSTSKLALSLAGPLAHIVIWGD